MVHHQLARRVGLHVHLHLGVPSSREAAPLHTQAAVNQKGRNYVFFYILHLWHP